MRHFALVLLFALWLVFSFAATTVPAGNVYGTWNFAGSPYQVTGNLVIPNGQTLIIQPGVQVIFQGYHRITVNGSLKAIGAPGDSIRFAANNPEHPWRGMIMEHIPAANDSTIISRCIFEWGDATVDPINKNGGAMRVLNCPKLRIDNSRFQYMYANYGGALYLQAAQYRVERCEFKNCGAQVHGGAVLKAESPAGYASGSLAISGCDFANNSSIDSGGGLCVINGDNYVDNCRFYSNFAYQGGGLAFTFCTGAITNCLFRGNIMYTAGGGIYIRESTALISANVIQNSTWITDYHYPKGSGIYVSQSVCDIVSNYIANNHAHSNGGGISLNSSTFKVLNNLIVNNSTSQRGGGIFCESWNPACEIVNNVVSNNTCGAYAGSALHLIGAVNVSNNVLWGNSGGSGQIYVQTDGSTQYYDYNCIEGGISSLYAYPNGSWQPSQYGDHNTSGNPAFVSPSAGAGTGFDGLAANWTIQSTSSCYNTGDPATDISLYPVDLAGNIRVSEGVIDIGAYEYINASIPKAPQNVRIIRSSGYNAILQWDLVTQALDGSPIDVDTYKIYYAPSAQGPWNYLGTGTNGQSALPSLNNPAPALFYMVRAFIND